MVQTSSGLCGRVMLREETPGGIPQLDRGPGTVPHRFSTPLRTSGAQTLRSGPTDSVQDWANRRKAERIGSRQGCSRPSYDPAPRVPSRRSRAAGHRGAGGGQPPPVSPCPGLLPSALSLHFQRHLPGSSIFQACFPPREGVSPQTSLLAAPQGSGFPGPGLLQRLLRPPPPSCPWVRRGRARR